MNLMITSFFTQNLFYVDSTWFSYNGGFLDCYENGAWRPYTFLIDCGAIWVTKSDQLLLKVNNKTSVYKNGKMVKMSRGDVSELEIAATAKKMGSWVVHYIPDEKSGGIYRIKSIETGEVISFEGSSYLIGALEEYFYFKQRRSEPLRIVKKNKSGNTLEEYEVGSCSFVHLQSYFIALSREKQEVFVFDLKSFTVIASIKCSYKSAFSLFFWGTADGVDFISCDSKLLTWDGQDLIWRFEGKDVCLVHPKNNFVYVSFNDSKLYAYDVSLQSSKGKKELLDGYSANEIFSSDGLNFASISKQEIVSDMEVGRYLASWTDEEFFSDNWEVQFELSICEKQRITAKVDDFDILINVNKHENFSVVARQSMAMLDDVIRGYGVGRQEPLSKNFTGKVKLCYKDAKYIKKQQRSQLEKAAKDLVEVKYSLYEGPATGEYCSVELVFED